MTTQDDPPGPNPKQAAAARARMERLSRLGAAGAIMMQQRAAERRSHAADLTARGDHLGAKFEVAEADELELDAEDILHPLSHTIAPVQIGRGGEMATGAAMMQPFLDTVRTRPDWLVHDASRERMELASKAGALTMGLDAVETIQARDSTEKMLMHQLAAAHSLAMRMAAASGEDLAAYKNSGHRYPHRSIEACRSANTAARLMDAYQRGLLTLDRLRNGGRQMVTELETWKQDAIGGLGEPRETESVAVKQDRRRIKELERELHRKDKALAETAALLVLSKNKLGPAARLWR